jgi:hypothetical protein
MSHAEPDDDVHDNIGAPASASSGNAAASTAVRSAATKKRRRSSQESGEIPKPDAQPNEAAFLAQTVLRPSVQSAITLDKIDAKIGRKDLQGDHKNLAYLVEELSKQTKVVCEGNLDRGEGMLAAQAHVLDSLFNVLTRLSVRNLEAQFIDASETLLRLALRAQSQCRATWEAISAIQNPPMANYVAQANVANTQQVNNGALPPRGQESESPPNKLLEQTTHEPDKWLDRGTAPAPAPGDSAVEAVGPIDGAQDPRRKG